MLDYGALPPEINSARMYAGPGSAPMLAAASAWRALAAELSSTAAGYQAIVSELAGEEWLGPSSASMAAAVAPYVAWMNTTAARAEQAAAQATAAAGAYAAAFSATVPPPLVAANRAQLAALVATNFLGQNTPAIAATEVHYGQMWAQDTGAMYGYAAASATATKVSPFTTPAQTTSPAAPGAAATAVGQAVGASGVSNTSTALSGLTAAITQALQGLASPLQSGSSGSGLGGILNGLFGNSNVGPNANMWNTITSSGALNPAVSTAMMADIGMMSALNPGLSGFGASPGPAGVGGLFGATRFLNATTPVGGFGSAGLAGLGVGGTPVSAGPIGPSPGAAPVSAGMGRATLVGALSAPQTWAATAPATGPVGTALAGTGSGGVPAGGMPGMPGMPMGGLFGNGFGNALPKYGIRPTVMARPPAAG